MSEISAILFDIGGPLVDDDDAIHAWHKRLREIINDKKGRVISPEEINMALADAIKCYAPSFISYIIWQFARPDRELFSYLRKEADRFPFEDYFKVRPGVKEMLARLHGKFKLGIAANQQNTVSDYLEKEGILKFFDSTQVSEGIGYNKPDIRLFLKVLENLGSAPSEAIMVGDRQDNDIVPAKLIGMKAVRFRVGFHRDQEVRYPKEEADYTISKIEDFLKIPPHCG